MIKENYRVVKIKNELAHPWLLNKHYAHTIPSISFVFGLYNNDSNILEGVCCYGMPANPNNSKVGNYEQIELVRLVVNEGLPKNILSYFVGQTFRLLPKPLSLVSYADSGMSHHGYIYQATNWIYTGMGEAVAKWFRIKDNKMIHNRTLTSLHKKCPEITMAEMCEQMGIKKVCGSSKYRYYYFIGDKPDRRKWLKELKKIRKIQPYPKGENKRYEIKKDKCINTILDI